MRDNETVKKLRSWAIAIYFQTSSFRQDSGELYLVSYNAVRR